MKILIIAYYYPPETYAMMASLRPLSWAKYWSQQGHEIQVLTTTKNRSLPELHPYPNVTITEVAYNPFASRRNSPSPSQQTALSSQTHFLQTIKTKSRNFLLFLQKNLGVGTLLYASNLWTFTAYFKAKQLYSQSPFDIVVSTFSPPTDHIVAHLLKRKFNCFWVADYRDLWFGNHLSKSNILFSQLENLIELKITSNVDLASTVSNPLKSILSQRLSCPITIIENGYDDVQKVNSQGVVDQTLTLVYTGTLYPNHQNVICLLRAIAKLDNRYQQKIEIQIFSSSVYEFQKIFRLCPVNSSINLMGFVPRKDCLEYQQKANLLIFLDWNDPNIEGILTGKLFEYMASGTPIINIGSDRPTDASRLIDATGIGINLGNDPQAIANYLTRIINGEKPYYQPNFEVIEQYSREKLALKFLEQILIAYQEKDAH